MIPIGAGAGGRRQVRRDLVRKYVALQRDLIDGDPAASSYQATIHSFRQMGYTLISAGFEEDLDRLLRLRVLEGGRAVPHRQDQRSIPRILRVVEKRVL